MADSYSLDTKPPNTQPGQAPLTLALQVRGISSVQLLLQFCLIVEGCLIRIQR
jgi:hypothetical protein